MKTSESPANQDESKFIDKYLGQVDVRVDLVRMDVYRLIINAKNVEDVYLDEIFNRFISVAQAPLNFAIYDKRDNLLFHFINDIKYHDYFTVELQKSKYAKRAFGLFPSLFSGKYKILVLHVKTKRSDQENWVEAINFTRRNWDKQSQPKMEATLIDNLDTYLERCVWRFFHARWHGLDTQLGGYAADAIEAAIKNTAINFRPFSDENYQRLGVERHENDIPCWPPETSFLDEEISAARIPSKNKSDKGWHEKLKKIFYPILRDSTAGLNAQHLLMHPQNGQTKSTDTGFGIPNMLIAYRSFTRKSEDYRYEVPFSGEGDYSQKQGYLYNTQFLIPDPLEMGSNPIWDLFTDLQRYSEFDEDNKTNTYANKRRKQKGKRQLYRNIFSNKIKPEEFPNGFQNLEIKDQKVVHSVYRYITKKLDQKFWEMLSSPQGIKKCIDVLRSPVGDNTRSLTDSVYYTGLIHTNFVFDFAGIDRIRGLGNQPSKEDGDKYIQENENDLLRIVMLFYLFSEMVNWNGSIENFDPRKIAAVLVPIKMRGSVWGVTIHATYVENKDTNFENVAYWISYYHLTTTLRLKNQKLFDRVLWDNVQRRVSRTLEKSMIEFSGADNFIKAMKDFNAKMRGEQRLVPYALPQIELGLDASSSKDYVNLVGMDGKNYRLPWKNADNNFYLAAQSWNRVGTRSFQQSVVAGLDRGFESQ